MALLTGMWISDCALIFSCLFIGIYLYFVRNFNYWKKRGVKQIKPVPVFGNIGPVLLRKKPFANFLIDYYKASGNDPYIGMYFVDRPYLLICDPELIKNILIKDFNYFTSRMAKSLKGDKIGNSNLFVIKNPEWKYLRQQISPVFTTGKLKRMIELMLEADKDLKIYLESLHLEGEGRSLEVKDICAKFTTEVIGLTGYGMKFNALQSVDTEVRKTGKRIFQKSYQRFLQGTVSILIPSLVDVFRVKFFGEEATNFLRDLFWRAMDHRAKTNAKRGDLIDFLLEIKKKQEESFDVHKFDEEDLIAQAAAIFAGGFETSSTTMSFALFELAKNPDIQQRLREEILEALSANKGEVVYEMLTSQLPYLDMVVAEILRKYPILPFLDRVAESDYKVPNSDLVIEAGTPVIIPMHAIHMDENYFSNPYIFDPERFSEKNKQSIKSNTYFPFGDGPRICIGMRIGLMQTKLGLIRLLADYEFSPCEETASGEEFDTFTFILNFPNDVVLNVKKRKAVR